jgi:flagellar biosynthetic protein FliQ
MYADETLLDIVRQALWLAVIVSAPILGAGVLIGLIISIFQSITSIQEQTLTFVPKILVMIGVAVLLMAWIVDRLVAFTGQMMTFV